MRAADANAGAHPGGDERPVWLLLHELDDASAEPLRRALAPAAEAAGGVLLAVPAPALLQARSWSLRMGSDGVTQSTLQLGPHRIASHRLRAVLNRLGPVQLPGVGAPADAAYLQQEWQAVLAFWLASLPCPVLNAAQPIGLCGPQATPSWWRLQAAQAGLPTRSGPGEATAAGLARTRLLVLGDRCLPAPESGPSARQDLTLQPWLDALPAFARQLGVALLEVWLARERGGPWVFDHADPRPLLRALDGPVHEALLDCLALRPSGPARTSPLSMAHQMADHLTSPPHTASARECHP